jgi:hypothetical protein
VGLAISGIAWLFSSLTTSPMLSVWAGMVSPPAIIGGTAYMNHLFELRMSDDQLGLFCAGICLTLGIAGFIAGTWYYLRRVEP